MVGALGRGGRRQRLTVRQQIRVVTQQRRQAVADRVPEDTDAEQQPLRPLRYAYN